MKRRRLIVTISLASAWGILMALSSMVADERQFSAWIRFYTLACCYVPLACPLCFHADVERWKPFAMALLAATTVIIACVGVGYFLAPHPNWADVAVIYLSFCFLLFSLALLLSCTRLTPLWSSFVASIVGTAMMGNLLFSGPLLRHFASFREPIVAFLLHANPMVAVATCFPNYDYLRAGILYEVCPIGSSHPFEYPLWYHVSIAYALLGSSFVVFARWIGRRQHEIPTNS